MAHTVRINLYKKRGLFDALGWQIAVQQRSGVTHACIEVDGICYTTGARWDWRWLRGYVFGAVPAEKYNKGREYYQCEFVVPLTDDEVVALLEDCRSLFGMRYGLGKVLKLTLVGNLKPDFVCRIDNLDLGIKNPFCSQSVVWLCWRIGKMVCRWLCRQEPEVCSPHDLYLEALRGKIIKLVGGVGVELPAE